MNNKMQPVFGMFSLLRSLILFSLLRRRRKAGFHSRRGGQHMEE